MRTVPQCRDNPALARSSHAPAHPLAASGPTDYSEVAARRKRRPMPIRPLPHTANPFRMPQPFPVPGPEPSDLRDRPDFGLERGRPASSRKRLNLIR